MHFDWWTFALQLVNFAVLVWLLHRFLYRPVLRIIDARQAAVAKQYAEADATEAKAKADLAAIDQERAKIAAEREAAVKSAAVQGEQAAKERAARAEQEATALLGNARKTLAAEREKAFDAARRAALDLGTDMARRLLDAIPLGLRAEAWLEHIEAHLKGLTEQERKHLAGRGDGPTVVTPFPLSEDTQHIWTSRLRTALGDSLAISFDVDPKLIAGAELHFPTAILRFSWQSTITALRAEIENHGQPI